MQQNLDMAKETKAAKATCFHPCRWPSKSDCPPCLYLDRSRIPSTGNHAESNVFAAASNLAWDHQVCPKKTSYDPWWSTCFCCDLCQFDFAPHFPDDSTTDNLGFQWVASFATRFVESGSHGKHQKKNLFFALRCWWLSRIESAITRFDPLYVYFTFLEDCPSFTEHLVGNYACC